MDLIIIIFSTALAVRFKQITKRLENCEMETTTITFWSEIRADYTRLSALCRFTNQQISFIIFLSFLRDFEVIIFKLFQNFR